jgi:hypothetical protein
MSTSQRVSRGFHRLALFLAAIPFLVGVAFSASGALDHAKHKRTEHAREVVRFCGKTKVQGHPWGKVFSRGEREFGDDLRQWEGCYARLIPQEVDD